MSRSDFRPRTPFQNFLYWLLTPVRWMGWWVRGSIRMREEKGDGDVFLGTAIAIPLGLVMWFLLIYGTAGLTGCPSS